ncbi:hypothetical protein BC826DRAFT_914681 [Russula brevipes]|nr:hypothetical protein BC826DRAFT_914681 [Russula brevipes]
MKDHLWAILLSVFSSCQYLMRYDTGRRIVHQRKELPFKMCGQKVSAKADVCVMEHAGPVSYVLLVQEDKVRKKNATCPTSIRNQLVAEAIAAFHQNNKAREHAGLAAVTSAVIPGITVLGSAPTFFKIPVSRALVKAVVTSTPNRPRSWRGSCPPSKTL